MTTIQNYLKGNLLVQKHLHVTSIESTANELDCARELFRFSYHQNIKNSDRVTLHVNFDIMKPKSLLYDLNQEKSNAIRNNEIVLISTKTYVLEYNYNWLSSKSKENDLSSAKHLLSVLDTFAKIAEQQHAEVPCVLFVQGLEVLGIYLSDKEMIEIIQKLINITPKIKLIYFLLQSDALSGEVAKAIDIFTNCRIIIEASDENKEETTGTMQTVYAKNSGYSYIEYYTATISKKIPPTLKIEKAKKAEVAPTVNKKDINKLFGASFNLELTDQQKKSKGNVSLPYLKAQDSNVYKDDLVKLQNQDEDEMIDPEQDEDEDLDV